MRSLWLWLALTLILAPRPGWGNSSWRIYRASDGLNDSFCSSVSVGPGGRIWIKHGRTETLSGLDGFDFQTVVCPKNLGDRLCENTQGQLWACSPEGLQRLRGGHWESFPIPEIQREYRVNAIRRMITPVPLLPILSQSVLIGLPDRLLLYHAGKSTLTPIKLASETGLGQFNDLAFGPRGAIWVSGAKGVARLLLESSQRSRVWEEHACPGELGVLNLQRLAIDDRGGVTTVAEVADTNQRALVHLDNDRWETHPMLKGRLHRAWVDEDRNFWAYGINVLGRLDPDGVETVERENLVTGRILDVATEPKGVFWLATSEGLLRFAPLPWRTPVELARSAGEVLDILQDGHQRLWVATASGLLEHTQGRWLTHPLPEGSELVVQPTDALACLRTGQLAVRGADRLLVFNPTNGQYATWTHPEHRTFKWVGRLPEGAVCLQTFEPQAAATNGPYRLEAFDGERCRVLLGTNDTRTLGEELYCCTTTTNRDLWIGGNAGVFLWRDERVQSFSRADGAPPGQAFCLLEMGDGKLWCGGYGRIIEFDGHRWSVVQTGFDRVSALARAQDGSVWVASNEGVHRFSQGAWLLNSTDEGLPSTAVYRVFPDDKGVVWAGTARGLSRRHADADIDPPRAYLESAENLNSFPLDSPILITVRGQDKWKFTAPERLVFSTRLDSEKWSPYAAQTTLSFKDLIPGKHRIEARAMDRNGNVNSAHPAVFDFTIVLPWYLETRLLWIVAAGFAAIAASVFFAINRHLRLKRSYAEIELTVQERTRELQRANEALLHSQKMQALGTMAAGIAHDFNNILSIIKGSVQIIEEHSDDRQRVHTRVDRIRTMVDQGTGIVKALLGYSRNQARDMVLCDPNEVVEETIHILHDRLQQGIELERRLLPDLPPVCCVKELLEQMILNLILNASEAMAGEGRIVVSTGVSPTVPANTELAPQASPGYVVVAVQDRGCGINPEIRPRIFEPFFTTKALSTRRGTGLGLSMVYEFARSQGFGIRVDSAVGQGSTFTLYLPLASAPAKPF